MPDATLSTAAAPNALLPQGDTLIATSWQRRSLSHLWAMAGGAGETKEERADMIKRLHHNAYRCRDSEETRRFYEDFLGLPLAHSIAIKTTATGRDADVLHTFYQLEDGSCLAFFEAPGMPFDFKEQHDFDLHIAVEVDAGDLESMFTKGRALGIETRGITDHGFCRSAYFRDPNGYVIELSTREPG